MDHNVLKRFGMTIDMGKSMSISFITDYADCGYRTFLQKIVKVPYERDMNKLFGSACHAALSAINHLRQENLEPCGECPNACKIILPSRIGALELPEQQCAIQKIINETFRTKLSKEVLDGIREQLKARGKTVPEIENSIKLVLDVGPLAVAEMVFRTQPTGTVLATEQPLNGKIGGISITGVVDLIYVVKDKVVMLDYKTTSLQPKDDHFPLRQFTLYDMLLEQQNLPIDVFSAAYMIKKRPPTRGPNKDKEHRYTKIVYAIKEKIPREYERVRAELEGDLQSVRFCLSNGIFMRNYQSMFCPCEAEPYCQSDRKVEQFLAERSI